jgi:hypothetical protein
MWGTRKSPTLEDPKLGFDCGFILDWEVGLLPGVKAADYVGDVLGGGTPPEMGRLVYAQWPRRRANPAELSSAARTAAA